MKPSATRAATARVLAEIDDAVRPVERARTAAAVDRVLASAAPSIWGENGAGFFDLPVSLFLSLGVARYAPDLPHECECGVRDGPGTDMEICILPRMTVTLELTPIEIRSQRERYAPWNVSPHLFPTDPR